MYINIWLAFSYRIQEFQQLLQNLFSLISMVFNPRKKSNSSAELSMNALAMQCEWFGFWYSGCPKKVPTIEITDYLKINTIFWKRHQELQNFSFLRNFMKADIPKWGYALFRQTWYFLPVIKNKPVSFGTACTSVFKPFDLTSRVNL